MRALHIIKSSKLINDLACHVCIKTAHYDIDFKSGILENDPGNGTKNIGNKFNVKKRTFCMYTNYAPASSIELFSMICQQALHLQFKIKKTFIILRR